MAEALPPCPPGLVARGQRRQRAPSPATTSTSASRAPSSTSPATDHVDRTRDDHVHHGARRWRTIAELLALGRPIVLAHTGGEDEYPGSTLFGYGESVKAGVDMLDLNVMLTADGVLVVQHDDTVDRMTNGTGKVAAMTYAELARSTTRTGSRPTASRATILTTPTCTAASAPANAAAARLHRRRLRRPDVARARRALPTMPLNVEIEGSGERAGAAARVLATELRDLGRRCLRGQRVRRRTVAAFHRLDPTVEMSPGIGANAAWVLNEQPLPDGTRDSQLPPRSTASTCSPPSTSAHARRRLPRVGVAERSDAGEPSCVRRLPAHGMDGLNINFPAQGVAAAHEFVPTTT